CARELYNSGWADAFDFW
nr:immunoglobulin heavy chain junction region [Macaca mulatta]MOX61878.1 immunoglobulin heavy chain junction region [Macaca mulatta]MOX63243.1 immunoglobulin heavy chain junction region [Macaca mulatta]MOX65800.1 immunoglobulin heavy chain junction region [Macaca mulatta]MOX66391.1 immunoglobulin heavy chain junction region [Macaca mulatta]